MPAPEDTLDDPAEDSPPLGVLDAEGPWRHREISAAGARFHAVEAGEGPLILLLHGFPECWWAWRHQIPLLADAGFRAVAVDLRGFGGSDKPPRGYDPRTAADDVAGMVRSLGERDAMVVGHGLGGYVAWTLAATAPRVVRRLAVLSSPHPLTMRAALANPRQLRASWYVTGMQIPRADRYLRRRQAAAVLRLTRGWAGPMWPDPETERAIRETFLLGNTPHCALEYYRWPIRSALRPDGLRYARSMAVPITVPTLQIHGTLDGCVLPDVASRSCRHVDADYRWVPLPGVGHFPHEEARGLVGEHLLAFARLDQG